MVISLTKYIPPEVRLEIAQEVIEENGIRPLARKLDVNPKSVYKYKKGTSHPGDRVMSKILTVADGDEKIALSNYLENLRTDFLQALESDFDSDLSAEREGQESSRDESVENKTEGMEVDQEESFEKEKGVVQESTEEDEKRSSVDEGSTEELGLNEVCERIGVSQPFNRSKVEKILDTLIEEPNSKVGEVMEISNLSRDAVEKYLEKLKEKDIIQESSDESYKLVTNILIGD